MASSIDATKPADDVKVDKAEMRANWAAAKSEITALQRQTRLAYKIAFGDISV